MSFVNVVGVQFRRAGKIYDFDALENRLKVGDHVVVETDRGPSLAQVATLKYIEKNAQGEGGLKPIVRVASDRDLDPAGKLDPDKATAFAKDRISRLGLEMHVLKAEVQFGGNKVIVFFSAPGRVDFRDLVKDLAGGLKARVELKQVGARDEAKLVGGVGICGREYCCSSFLREFVPVSIKMAKNQNLALNPSKVSGGCGRLLCCLTYENDTYVELRKRMPGRGARVRTMDGVFGDVVKTDLLNQLVVIENDTGQQIAAKVAEVEIVAKGAGTASDDAASEWGQDIDLQELNKLSD